MDNVDDQCKKDFSVYLIIRAQTNTNQIYLDTATAASSGKHEIPIESLMANGGPVPDPNQHFYVFQSYAQLCTFGFHGSRCNGNHGSCFLKAIPQVLYIYIY